MTRSGNIERSTGETRIEARVTLDAAGETASSIVTPDGFFSHMLDALSRHSGIALQLEVEGDTEVDLHHTVEDTGIAVGEALDRALGERVGVVRFAHAYAPLDEALARAVVDLSGRGFFVWEAPERIERAWVTQQFPLTLVADFFQALADRARLTLHLTVIAGRNPHHVAEACFKAVAVALRQAVAVRPHAGVPSTKGTLSA